MYFENNTSGSLELIAFPDIENMLSGTNLEEHHSFRFETEAPKDQPNVAGSFEFETEDPEGQSISVKGEFSFNVK